MTTAALEPARLRALHDAVLGWYAATARPLPWRRPDATAWEVLVSEVMSQQTPLARVEPVWRTWLARWPTPADLAAASPADVVRAWDRMGYPRRALWLRLAAVAIVERHDGLVPRSLEDLLALPGVGPYTAAAVACFAFGQRVPVLDTNVRRVLARTLGGREPASGSPTAADRALAAWALPEDRERATVWNVAAMELGALVCSARRPACGQCPAAFSCAWFAAGRPAPAGAAPRPGQRWQGTDRQARGALLAVLRREFGPVPAAQLAQAWPDEPQRSRCLDSLLADGLVAATGDGSYELPG